MRGQCFAELAVCFSDYTNANYILLCDEGRRTWAQTTCPGMCHWPLAPET